MSSEIPSHLETNRDVRRILVSHWIDLGHLSIRSVRNTVHIRGIMQRLPGAESELSAATLEAAYRQIGSVPNVRHVNLDLENWTRNSATGAWEPVGDRQKKKTPGPGSEAGETASVRVILKD